MSARRGDVYWIPPEALRPHVAGEPHPWVVVQDDVFNQSRIPTLVVCGISSQMKRASEAGNVVLDAGEAGLPKQSVVVVSQICAVDRDRLGDHVGRLSDERVDAIVSGLRFQQRCAER